ARRRKKIGDGPVGTVPDSLARLRWRRRRPGRRRWRRRGLARGAIGRVAPGHRDLMALRVHALLVVDVVALLQRVTRGLRSTRAGERPAGETDAGAHPGARIAAEQSARCRADRGADDGALYRGVVGRLGRRGAADLRGCVLAAIVIVIAELIEALAGAGQHHHARPGWRRRRAAREQRDSGKGENRALHWAGAGAGGTAFQPLGHSLT